ncbi:MAG: histidinol dehydrogenase [Clostridia bacterium]|nr:histidinol dehydrogenase [Clostridia bacterium]
MIKILDYQSVDKSEIFSRFSPTASVGPIVEQIINQVKERGDSALIDFALKFDGAKLQSIKVSQEEIDLAYQSVDKNLINILIEAYENIKQFHQKQLRQGFEIKKQNGVIIGQKITPIERVGLYVPGGTAAYPSTVLMDSVPALVAGCKDVCITTPPNKEGKINPVILAAAKIAGVKNVYKTGGAGAIAALAYGTETIEKVDKIVGPGNAFVAEAKRQVFGKVSIDMIAGPSEILIIADGKSNPEYVAADLLSQAEHDVNASAVLVTDSVQLAKAVSEQLEKQIPLLERNEIARASIDNNGKIILAKDFEQVISVSNEIAPEHLELCVDNPFEYLDKIQNAGSIFLGRYTPEALGDYFAGPNHTLPTSGTARFSSPLSVDDFIKKSQYVYYTENALSQQGEKVSVFAKSEGLTAHAKSVTVRLEEKQK